MRLASRVEFKVSGLFIRSDYALHKTEYNEIDYFFIITICTTVSLEKWKNERFQFVMALRDNNVPVLLKFTLSPSTGNDVISDQSFNILFSRTEMHFKRRWQTLSTLHKSISL